MLGVLVPRAVAGWAFPAVVTGAQLVARQQHRCFSRVGNLLPPVDSSMAGPTPVSNWLVPGRVVVGGFPAVPGDDEAHYRGLAALLDANVRLFVQLNAEGARSFVHCCSRRHLTIATGAWACSQVPHEDDHDGRAVFERPWYRAYEADARRLAREQGLLVGFTQYPMVANTAGEEECTVQLVARLKAFVDSAGEDKALYIHCSGGHGVSRCSPVVLVGKKCLPAVLACRLPSIVAVATTTATDDDNCWRWRDYGCRSGRGR